MRRVTLSINADVDCGGLGRADSGSKRSGIQCSEHGSGILVDHSQQCASWRFWGPPPALPVLYRVEAEPKSVREFGLRHAQSVMPQLEMEKAFVR